MNVILIIVDKTSAFSLDDGCFRIIIST